MHTEQVAEPNPRYAPKGSDPRPQATLPMKWVSARLLGFLHQRANEQRLRER